MTEGIAQLLRLDGGITSAHFEGMAKQARHHVEIPEPFLLSLILRLLRKRPANSSFVRFHTFKIEINKRPRIAKRAARTELHAADVSTKSSTQSAIFFAKRELVWRGCRSVHQPARLASGLSPQRQQALEFLQAKPEPAGEPPTSYVSMS